MRRTLRVAMIALIAILPGRALCGQAQLKQLNDDMVQLAAKVAPWVVEIQFESPAQTRVYSYRTPAGGDPKQNRAEIMIGGAIAVAAQEPTIIRGSGVLMTEDGYILTAADHLRGKGDVKIKVKLSDGYLHEGKLVGRDLRTGLAVIKAEAKEFSWAQLAEKTPPVGSLVIAMGDTAGMGKSISLGILSGTKRAVAGAGPVGMGSSTQYGDLLQITNPVTPSDVGGIAVDVNGKMIGILHSSMTGRPLVARSANTPGQPPGIKIFGMDFGGPPMVQGVSFATPVEVVHRVFDSLRSGKKVEWGFLGLYYNIQAGKGLLARNLVPQGPAAAAGVKEGDVITALKVPGQEELKLTGDPREVPAFAETIGWAKPGTEVTLVILRDGQPQEIKVKLGTAPEMPEQEAEAFQLEGNAAPEMQRWVEDFAALMRRPWLGALLEDTPAGPKVTQVPANSPAERHGLKVGDIVTTVGGKDVKTAAEVTQEIEKRKAGERVQIGLIRGEQKIIADVELGLGPGAPTANIERIIGAQNTAYMGLEAKDTPDGLKVGRVFEGSPAEKAGVKVGDVILRADNKDVAALGDLRAIILNHKPGDEIAVTVKRNDKEIDLKVKLGKVGAGAWNAQP